MNDCGYIPLHTSTPLEDIINDLEGRITALEEAAEVVCEPNESDEMERTISDLEAIILEQDEMLHEALARDKEHQAYREAADNEIARLRSAYLSYRLPTIHTITWP